MMVISMAQNVYMLSMAFLVPLRRLSTSKYEVYSKSVPSSMWGSGYTRYNAISKDYKEYITWDDGSGADKRKRYYEIDINELLPKSVENYDFLE